MSIGTLPQRTVGIRSGDEIHDALQQLPTRRDKPRPQGARAALGWALDPWKSPPIPMEPSPADVLLRLMAQERTAIAVRHDPRQSPQQRRYARGVAQALGWILGYKPDLPLARAEASAGR
ncbi:hypothetical protein KNE206_31590 [Kitasatospora sp. NE20-6]|uniref:hypothetical protein n=1 Tax=Kitasatospora sp. NE20-6 TaxID=2859066 RepID=UPI0034DBDA69